MLIALGYKSKKELKESIGKTFRYRETSVFGPEYPASGTGSFVCSNRPQITGLGGREFFAQVTVVDNKITVVK